MKIIGYAPGAYDLFHVGHLNVLRRAREHCDHLIAGVVTDEILLEVKHRAPVVPLEERLEVVASLRFVDEVVVDRFTDKFRMWPLLRYNLLFKGDDWRGTERGRRLEADLARVGARVHYLPYTRTVSSSHLRELIRRAG